MNKVNDVIVIGAGPVGIAAAANLVNKGINPIVLEKGEAAGAAMKEWGHVRVFTPWSYVTNEAVVTLLEKNGWQHPDKDYLPTGAEIVEQYLKPATQMPELVNNIKYQVEVVAVSKEGHSKHTSKDRDDAKFTVHYKEQSGEVHVIYADAVIDASGTWSTPNPIGLDGLPVPGELENQDHISYGIPDIKGKAKSSFAGKRSLVIGAGHSAMNIALDLLKLQAEDSDTKIFWGLRKNDIDKLIGGGINDKVPARRELGLAAQNAIEAGNLELFTQLKVKRITKGNGVLTIQIESDNFSGMIEVDNIVVATGFRPNLNMIRELRLDIDHVVEAPSNLAPLIDPNLHSCGSVRPHGVEELSHFDKNFFIVGMKAYGRAPTFLMLTGYEQVRSVVAELSGDYESARDNKIIYPDSQFGKVSEQSKNEGYSCMQKACQA